MSSVVAFKKVPSTRCSFNKATAHVGSVNSPPVEMSVSYILLTWCFRSFSLAVPLIRSICTVFDVLWFPPLVQSSE